LTDDVLKLRSFLTQSLRSRLITPELRMFEVPIDLFETLPFAIEVKDTPSGPDLCPANP